MFWNGSKCISIEGIGFCLFGLEVGLQFLLLVVLLLGDFCLAVYLFILVFCLFVFSFGLLIGFL